MACYRFDPATARRLLREAGAAEGVALTLIASEELQVQATVVSKMLEQADFTVELQILDGAAFNRKICLSHLDQPPAQQLWDIALMASISRCIRSPMTSLSMVILIGSPRHQNCDSSMSRSYAQSSRRNNRR